MVVFKCVYSQVVGLRDGYMASTESQCTRNTRDIRDSRYVVPCVRECTSELNVKESSD